MDLEIDERKLSERRSVLSVRGRLNAFVAPQLKAHMKKLTERNQPEVIIDLSGLTFMDSSGLAVLVSGLKSAREHGGWLRLAGANDQVASIFKLTLLDRVFEMYPGVEQADR
jgi:anti-sigma B factor antagonist